VRRETVPHFAETAEPFRVTPPEAAGYLLVLSVRPRSSRLSEGLSRPLRRAPRLFNELMLAHADGSYPRLLARLAKIDVLVIEDWGLAAPTDQERRDLLELLEDRYGRWSTIMTSQLPASKWHDHLGDPTIADAVRERILHNAHRLALKGPSRRKEEGIKE